MSNYLTTEKVKEIFTNYGGSATNTGSVEGQVALYTYRIEKLSEHLKKNRKDHACTKSLMSMVGKRKRLLTYLMHKDIVKYRELIEKLGIRK